MKDFLTILLQRAPVSSPDTVPVYYRKAFEMIYRIMVVYFFICFLINAFVIGGMYAVPLIMIGICACMSYYNRHLNMRINLLIYTSITLFWSFLFVSYFGWGSGGQHFLIPLVVVIFFSIYESLLTKILYWCLLVGFRMFLFSRSLRNDPIFSADYNVSILIQTLNSMLLFILLAVICTIFSSNIQAAEKQLLLTNQELKKEAGTDPLTGLPNRRAMMRDMMLYKKKNRDSNFAIAIADIDFFKKVNDTYGHNCGDYLLQELAKLFMRMTTDLGYVCRWGGEEFCFFFPDINLDQAGTIMHDICHAVEKMVIEYDGNQIRFTITAGVEENDYRSDLSVLIDNADNKLYMGKKAGRNRVVV